MPRPQVVDGGDGLQIWRVTVEMLNKQSRKVATGGPPALGLGEGLLTLHRKKPAYYEMLHGTSDLRVLVYMVKSLRVP